MILFGTISLNAQTYNVVGSGTTTNGASDYPTPFGNWYYGNKEQFFVSAAEISASGVSANNYIYSIGFNVINKNSVPILNNYTLKLYTTTSTNPLSGSWVTTGLVASSVQGNFTVGLGWNNLVLGTPYQWNGTDNFVIEICSSNSGWTSSGNASVANTNNLTGTTIKSRWYYDDHTSVCSSSDLGNTSATLRPNISFGTFVTLPNCSSPSALTATNVQAYEATLSWASTGTLFDISYGVTGVTPTTGILVNGVTNSYNLQGLSSATNYQYFVRNVCSETEQSPWIGPFSFTTTCAPFLTNFSQLFDTTPVGGSSNPSVPQCWAFIDTGTGYGYTYNYNSYSPSNCFYIYNSSEFAENYILVGPQTDNLGNGTKQLRFFARGGSNNIPLIVGTLSSQTNASSFTPLAVFNLTTSYVEYTVVLPAGTNDYFGFKHAGEQNYESIYIDNVYYEDVPLCPNVNGGTGLATNITNTQATLSWMSIAENFDIQYGVSGFTLGQGTSINNVGNNYVLTGLTQGTTYSYYVRSNCGADGLGEWKGPFNFTTESVIPSPWYEGFATSTIPVGFQQNGFSLTNTVANLLPATSYFYYRNVFTTTTSGGTVSTLNVGPILAGDKFSFDYRFAMYNGSGAVANDGVEILVEISTDFGANYNELVTLPSIGVDGWQNYETLLSGYVGQIVKLRFTGNWNSEMGLDTYIGMDNFFIGSCSLPVNPMVTNTTTNSAMITVTGLPTDSYEIEYGPLGFAQGTGTIVNGTGTSILITGLSQSTEYEYFIRRNCNAAFSPRLGKFKFITACPPFTTEFAENFDSTPTGSSSNQTLPICWTFHDAGNGYGYVNTGSSAPASPSKHFYIYNNSDIINPYILISPETDNLGNGGYQVRFKARGTSGAILKFGIMSNKLDASTFVEVQEIALPTSYSATDFVVYLPITTSDYFAFKFAPSGTYQSMYIDNVVYEPIPACAPPINLNANKNLSTLTAQLTWVGPANVTDNNFEVQWGPAGFTLGTGTSIFTNSYSANISNLNLGSSYSFYVKRICGSNSTTWSGPFTFEMGYCASTHSTYDGNGISNVRIGETNIPIAAQTYSFIQNSGVSINSNELIDSSINFLTGYAYGINIFIDLNNNGVFDNNELVYTGYTNSYVSPLNFDTDFIVPDTGDNVTGMYRMRIVTRDSNIAVPSPCDTSYYGVTIDLMINIVFPCIQPSNVVFTDVGYDYAVINWEGQGNSNFDLEYGPTGFIPGQGVLLQNVTKPYTLEGLIPGTTYDFYVRKRCADILTDWSTVATTYVFCDTSQPIGDSVQSLVEYELLSDLIINGQNLRFYTDPNLTQEVPASTVILESGVYFVTQTINCESDSYLMVQVNMIPRIAQPIVYSIQNFCDGGTISDINLTALPGAEVLWYSNTSNASILSVDTPLETGVYYVVQTDGVTTSLPLTINVTVSPTPVDLVSQDILLCGNYSFGSLSVNNQSGTYVRWYTSPTATTPLSNTALATTGIYYVTQSNGICESSRVPFQISQFESLNRPTAGIQTFCGSGTVGDLVAQGVAGAQLLWYASATSPTVLSSTTPLSTGTYYVAQTINGCFSDRRAVAVRVISTTAPVVSPFVICNSGTIADLYIPAASGVTFKWFTSPTSNTELLQSTPLTTGTYFVSRVQNGCESIRTAVQVTIGTIPNVPTGVSIQSFIEGATVADLILNQNNVVWYATYNDSQNGVNPLSPQIPLVNGATYYAVIIGTNGCPSLPFAVNVQVYLSNDQFVKEDLKYYPNPVVDILRITYSENISNIEVFDLLGKRVKYFETVGDDVQIDLSDLSSGTYMIQLKTDNKQQFIKVIKK